MNSAKNNEWNIINFSNENEVVTFSFASSYIFSEKTSNGKTESAETENKEDSATKMDTT